jgi:hypothetical protein
VEEADRRLIENDNFEGAGEVELEEDDNIVKRA